MRVFHTTLNNGPRTVFLPSRWQVGYPQSGNTWLCWLIAGLYDRIPQSWDELPRIIPNWDQCAMGDVGCPIGWVRAHVSYWNDAFESNLTEVIYIVRHPFDIMLSSYRYRTQYHGWTEGLSAYVDRFITNCGDPDTQHEMQTSTWNENVTSWLDKCKDANFALVRYMDLVADPHEVLSKIVKGNIPQERIDKAIEGALRERMARLDTQNFVGSGQVGRWKELLSKQQIKAGYETFGEVMTRLGYNE